MTAKLYSAAEAAVFLEVSGQLVRRLLLQGRLKGQKAGQGWVIYESELERFRGKERPNGRPPKRRRRALAVPAAVSVGEEASPT